MHKFLLYIYTDIFLPTRRGEKPTEENDNAAAPLSRSSGSVTDHQKRRFSDYSPAQIIGISPDDLSRWEFPCGRKWRQNFFFSAEDHGFQNKPNSFSVQTFFFSFPDLFGTKIHLGKFYLRSNRKSSLLSSSSRQCEHEWCVQRHPQSVGKYPLLFFKVIFTWSGTNTAAVATTNSGWTAMTSFSLAMLLPRFSFEFQWRDRTLISWCLYCPLLLNTWHLTSQWFVSKKNKKTKNRDFAEQITVWELTIVLIRFQRHI